ncbi:MAG: Plug domain-containing protein, partial [Bacteroidetes bacterium]
MILLSLLGLAWPARGQVDSTRLDSAALADFYDLPLQALDSVSIRDTSNQLDPYLNSPVSVAAQKLLSQRNAPGIITLITEEEIRNSGARDLIDLLRLVPGFGFALDQAGRVGIGVRGNWANEGKVLLLVDGLEMNDIYSGGLSFGNHYPVEMIKRIEIIRGPGSAIYGGFAGFAVIKVETYNGYAVSGLSAGFTRGDMGSLDSRRNRRFYAGKNWRNLTVN